MPDDIVNFGFVIEGQGEFGAVPLLIRRICNELFGIFALRTSPPVRITKSRLVREGELERAIRLARLNNQAQDQFSWCWMPTTIAPLFWATP